MRLQIRNATVELGAETILEHVNFEIHDREKIAVVGRNGCGKTTLLKLIAGDIEPANPPGDESFSMIMAGGQQVGFLRQINFTDREICVGDEIRKVFRPVYACEQRMLEIETSLTVLPGDSEEARRLLEEYASLQKKYDAMGGHEIEREMQVMFRQFGFAEEDLNRPIGTFSGGQQTKVAFIKLLLSKPDILLLDEPTNHLDLPAIEWLEGYLRSYRNAVVVVSHDRVFLDNVVSVTYEIEYHQIKRYAGNYSAFVRQKEEALLKQEKDYEAQQKEIRRLREWIEKWKNTPTKVSAAHSKERAIEHMVLIEKPRRFDTTTFRAHFSPRISSYSEVLDVRNLSIGYDHELSRLSFRLMRGERLAVVGENGKGKSTLLKTLIGEIAPLGGTYKIGTNVEIGYYDQQKAVINDEDPEQTILDNFWDTYPKLTNEEVRSTLGAFAFSQEEVEKKLGQLSGGEKVRLALCKMFYTRPNLLILDEPTNHMDILGKESLEKMLRSYDGTVLFVSHDRYFINQIATDVLTIGEESGGRAYPENGKDPAASAGRLSATGSGKIPAAGSGRLSATGSGKPPAAGSGKTPGTDSDKKTASNPGKIRSRLEHKIEKLHQQLAEAEQSAEVLNQKISDPALSTDYEKLMELQGRLDQAEAAQEEILMQILEIEEELKALEAGM
ncbi:MAG: ABC-F family ATP-binding cassette domain-containing protein [Parasporobacterium sp.]|nr:ABC-F family ATP-binding cassette domain-containing protein [Parasporobacterium sp.]